MNRNLQHHKGFEVTVIGKGNMQLSLKWKLILRSVVLGLDGGLSTEAHIVLR